MRQGGIGSMVALGVLVSVQPVWAAGLGIPLDTFIGQFTTFVTGLGLVVGTVGILGYVGSLMDNPFASILQGSVGFFTKAGILGGAGFILGGLGLVGGAVL